MSDRVSELAREALEWSYEKYDTDKSGYDREHWYAQRLAELVLEDCMSVIEKKNFRDGYYVSLALKNHFGMRF